MDDLERIALLEESLKDACMYLTFAVEAYRTFAVRSDDPGGVPEPDGMYSTHMDIFTRAAERVRLAAYEGVFDERIRSGAAMGSGLRPDEPGMDEKCDRYNVNVEHVRKTLTELDEENRELRKIYGT